MPVAEKAMSWRTFALIVGGLVLLVVLAVAGMMITRYLPTDQAAVARAIVGDAGAVFFGLLSSAFLFFAASRFPRGNPLRRIWLLLGIGIGVYAVGDIVWTVLDVNAGFRNVPYPSAADALYLAMYVFLAAGLIRAARAFGRVAYVERVVMGDLVLMFIPSVAVYVFVAAPIIVDRTASLAQKALGVAYPIGDLAALLGPALFIAFVASTAGKTQSVRHWWTLTFGLVVMALSDIAFTWLDWTGRYFGGHPVDYMWMLSLLIIGVAGSMAADVCVAHRAPAAAGAHRASLTS